MTTDIAQGPVDVNVMQAATVPKNAKPWGDITLKMVEQYEALIAALAPAPCAVCGEGVSYLAIENGHLMYRVCDKCGSDFAGKFEIDWNFENKARRLVATVKHNANVTGLAPTKGNEE